MKRNIVYDCNRVPVNKTAAVVTGSGVSYIPNCKIQVPEFDSPPALRPRCRYPKDLTFVDLTGKKKGRFTVIGLIDGPKPNIWVVRCSCGKYTLRTTKSIKRADNNDAAHLDACRECMHLAWLKREEIYRRTGKDVDIKGVWS